MNPLLPMHPSGRFTKRGAVVSVLLAICLGAGCDDKPSASATANASKGATPSPFAERGERVSKTPLRTATHTPDPTSNDATPVADPPGAESFPISFRIEAEPDTGGAPLTVQFAVDGDEDSAATFIWDFGDGSRPDHGRRVEHTFWHPGEYTTTLRGRSSGVEDSDEVTITVEEEGFDCEIEAAPDIGPAPLAVQFNAVLDEDLPGPFNFQWDFGDGASGASNPTSHTYRVAGEYTAVLTVSNMAGQWAQRDIQIQVDSARDDASE